MQFKTIGSGKEEIPEIGIGTWKMSGKEEEVEAIHEGISLGMKLVDTAEMYANEQMVGDAIKGTGVFTATKISPHHFKYDDVIAACEMSLKKLGLKQIDLYQLHWPNNKIAIGETMSAMEYLADTGKIRHIGVSNFSVEEMEEARAAMKKYEISSNQVEYSIPVRYIEDGVLDYCQKNKITVIAYSPIARGAILKQNSELYSVLSEVAEKHSKSIAQVALNWVVSKKNVVAIPKASSIKHMKDNAGASDFELSAKEISQITDAAPLERPMSDSIKPVISNHSFLAGAYSGISGLKNWRAQRKSKTTKSSKK